MKNRVITLLDKSSYIPKIPLIISRIFELLEEPSNTDIEQLIFNINKCGDFKDVILDFINSGYYSLNRKIQNLNEAISYLGYKTIRNILIAALTKSLFPERKGRSRVFDRKKYWKHCLGTALASDILAKKTGLYEKSELFPHGLTHDIGMLVLDLCLPKVLDKIYKNACANNLMLLKSEKEILEGITHADIGEWLCKKWNLTENIARVTAYHHSPFLTDDFKDEVKLVSIADTISMKYYEESLGIENNLLNKRLNKDMLKSFNIPMDEILNLKKELPLRVEKVYNNINLETLDISKFGLKQIC